ncbi:hypothetical protein H2199_000759 [Coniosporium tulheliwenetii]|uniref:Uncharacterized protein n=1 Tax=Coniosporium tulheliwenetii TaxID=3383036 RepID=A0ACC2ZMU5_9PEZI|nr:hypothetical protein H2199_000759 [Cladosporium sp. JES 115]
MDAMDVDKVEKPFEDNASPTAGKTATPTAEPTAKQLDARSTPPNEDTQEPSLPCTPLNKSSFDELKSREGLLDQYGVRSDSRLRETILQAYGQSDPQVSPSLLPAVSLEHSGNRIRDRHKVLRNNSDIEPDLATSNTETAQPDKTSETSVGPVSLRLETPASGVGAPTQSLEQLIAPAETTLKAASPTELELPTDAPALAIHQTTQSPEHHPPRAHAEEAESTETEPQPASSTPTKSIPIASVISVPHPFNTTFGEASRFLKYIISAAHPAALFSLSLGLRVVYTELTKRHQPDTVTNTLSVCISFRALAPALSFLRDASAAATARPWIAEARQILGAHGVDSAIVDTPGSSSARKTCIPVGLMPFAFPELDLYYWASLAPVSELSVEEAVRRPSMVQMHVDAEVLAAAKRAWDAAWRAGWKPSRESRRTRGAEKIEDVEGDMGGLCEHLERDEYRLIGFDALFAVPVGGAAYGMRDVEMWLEGFKEEGEEGWKDCFERR